MDESFLRLVIDAESGRAFYLETGEHSLSQLRFLAEEDADLHVDLGGGFSTFLPGDCPARVGQLIELADEEGGHVGVAAVTDRCTTQITQLFDLGYDEDHWLGLDGEELFELLIDRFGPELTRVHNIWTAVRLVRLEVDVLSEAAEPEAQHLREVMSSPEGKPRSVSLSEADDDTVKAVSRTALEELARRQAKRREERQYSGSVLSEDLQQVVRQSGRGGF